jgi:hypothetical protein
VMVRSAIHSAAWFLLDQVLMRRDAWLCDMGDGNAVASASRLNFGAVWSAAGRTALRVLEQAG